MQSQIEVKVCVICKRSLKKLSRSKYFHSNGRWYCKSCYWVQRKASQNAGPSTQDVIEENEDSASVENNTQGISLTLNIKGKLFSSSKCIFGCASDQHSSRVLRRLTKKECIEIYIQKSVFVSYGARVCNLHGTDNSFYIPEDFDVSEVGVSLCASEILEVFNSFKTIVLSERNEKESTSKSFLKMTEDELIFETGLAHSLFSDILGLLSNVSRARNTELELGVYLSRLRRGYTFEELANRWNIERHTASAYCQNIRRCLLKEFYALHCPSLRDREILVSHRTEIAKRLHAPTGDRIMLVLDGTYIFIQKSSNFAFQRTSYSGHKHRNLIKPMMAVCTDGYIVDVWGPYPGNKNDASILNELLQTDMWSQFEAEDVFLIDRGFRDSIPKLTEKGYVAKMPAFPDAQRRNLTSIQANQSRLVTKSRYIVEVINGRIKKRFKYFDRTINNITLSTLFDDFKIACALLNASFQPIITSELDEIIINKMLEMSDKINHLSELIRNENLNLRRSHFNRIESAEMPFFPELCFRDLRLYTCGTYQLKQAPGYYADHINEDGDFEFRIASTAGPINYRHYEIDIDPLNAILIKTQIRSRHSNILKYFVYVLLDKTKRGLDAIMGHTCGCRVGERVVGCCSHVTTILWYFGYARHQSAINLPADFLKDYFEDGSSSEEDNDD